MFPTSLQSLTNPTSGDTLATVPHATQHQVANDLLEALQAKVGIDSSAVATSLDYRIRQLELGTLPSVGYITVGPAGSGADYDDIQDALDVSGPKLIKLLGGTFTVTSTLLYKHDSTVIEGSYDSTVIEVDGSAVTTLIQPNTTGLGRCGLKNVRIIQTNASALGTALNLSNMPIFDLQHVYLFNFATGLKIDDTSNTSFYSSYRDLAMIQIGTRGIDIRSTNPVNDNLFENIRIATGANGIGLHINQGQGNVFYNLNTEPSTTSGTIGIKLDSAGTEVVDTMFIGAWVEGNGLGVEIHANALRTKFIGCNVGYNTTNIDDDSTGTLWLSCREQDSLKNDIPNIRGVAVNAASNDAFVAYINTTVATNRAYYASNDTNFAHSGDMFYGEYMNGTDSGHVFHARQRGTGMNFRGDNSAGTATFTVSAAGNVVVAGTQAVTGVATHTGGIVANGGITNATSNHIVPFIVSAAQGDITAGTGGAVPITNYYTTINTDAGGDAFTLANATRVGHMKKIQLIVDGGGDGVLTPTSLSGGTTITFADAGDFAILIWNGTAWVAIELGNAIDGITAPVLA